MTETINLVDRCTRRVQEILVPGIQNDDLTTQHDIEKRRESFLIWPTFDRNFNKWVKVSVSFNFFSMI